MPMDCRLRVLLVEDNEGDAVLVEEYLRDAFHDQLDFRRARKLDEGQRYLVDYNPHVILLDLNLPDSKGIATLESFCTLQAQDVPRPPIVVLTSLDDQEVAERAISGCAQDYLVKDEVNPRVLLRSIRFAIQRHGREAMDEILREPDKADGKQKQAMDLLQRVNRTAPGEIGSPEEDAVIAMARVPDRHGPGPGNLLLEHLSTGSKATEVIVIGLDQRIHRLEEAQQGLVLGEAHRKLIWEQLEKLIMGNGKGALSSRIDALEKVLLACDEARREQRSTQTQWLIALIVLVIGWVGSLVAWFISIYFHAS